MEVMCSALLVCVQDKKKNLWTDFDEIWESGGPGLKELD